MSDQFTVGMLSDTDIKKHFNKGIKIFSDEKDSLSFDLNKQLHIGSVDLHFRHLYSRFSLEPETTLTYDLLKNHAYTKPEELKATDLLRIEPGEIILTTTLEIVHLSEEFAALITGRSSIARLGIMVHCCQEFIHPGHGQSIPLQIVNLGPNPVELDINVPICQIVFFKLSSAASEKYTDRKDAKYSEEKNPLGSKIYEEISSNPKAISHEHRSPKDKDRDEKKSKSSLTRIKHIIRKFFSPYIPSIVMVLLVSPFIRRYIENKGVSDSILKILHDIPATYAIAIILIIINYIANKED